jgi:hypothetical protein
MGDTKNKAQEKLNLNNPRFNQQINALVREHFLITQIGDIYHDYCCLRTIWRPYHIRSY